MFEVINEDEEEEYGRRWRKGTKN